MLFKIVHLKSKN